MYGKSIDQAQSFIGGEYNPSDNPFIKFINAEGRLTQDFRVVSLLAEADVLGKQKTVSGVSLLHGTARVGERTMVGAYARLGFDKWGILMEHDLTKRKLKTGTYASFWQAATYAQLFRL